MVKVLLHHRDLMEDPNPSVVVELVQLRLLDVDPHKMERQLDGTGTKYLDIWYYDDPNWKYLGDRMKEHIMHKVRLGRFVDHEAWLEIDGTEWRYPEIVEHIAEVRSLLDRDKTERMLQGLEAEIEWDRLTEEIDDQDSME